jgi:hypothetical protein
MNQLTVSDIDLKFARGRYNIIDCGIRTGKTYWAINNLKNFTRDGNLNRILFLVDTNSLKESLLINYEDDCCDADDWWCAHSTWGEQTNKIGVMCYQSLGMRAMRNDLYFLNNIDCICWDECDSIFDFAAQAFAKARKTDFAREDTTNEEILAIIQKYSSKKEYMPLILLGEWEKIINDKRIMCIGLSATPERARRYYSSLVHSSNVGKLQTAYRMEEEIYFCSLKDHIAELKPIPGKGYWCFSPLIEDNQSTLMLANSLGFKAIELHSLNNRAHPMTEEQILARDVILSTGMVPAQYDFVIVNRALERGFNLNDRRFEEVIVDSYDANVRGQVPRNTFPYRLHLKTYAPAIPDSYLDKWLVMDECRELAELMAISDPSSQNSRQMTWNKLKDFLPAIGYSVEGKRKRINGKPQQCYFITGEWKDAEIEDGNFLALAAAKSGLDS